MKRIFILLPFILAACSRNVKTTDDELFTLMPSSFTHVDFINQLVETPAENMIEYLYFNNGAGVAAGDINNDGLQDLFFTSSQQSNKLYLGKGNLEFEDITASAGIAGTGSWKTGVTMADVNGDGWLDIYVCEVGKYKSLAGRNQLFINHGNLTFTDEAEKYGLAFQGFSTQAAFFDFDLDGDLDMYLLNHSVHTSRSYGRSDLRYQHDSLAGDRLYRNDSVNGHPYFTNVTSASGIYNSQIGYGLSIAVSDINDDGYPDIYVSNDFHENDYLYINNHDGTFTEQLTRMIEHTSRSSMGNDIADFNNDGLMDILVLDMLPDDEKIRKQSGGEDEYDLFDLKRKYGYNFQYVRNTLQLNLGRGVFSETGQLAGIESTDWSWSPLFCDVDNDGWKDIFITNGIYRRANDLDYITFLSRGKNFDLPQDEGGVPDKILYEKMPLHKNVNYLFRNNKDLTFTNASAEWGFHTPSFSNGSAWADLDNDGDEDLIVNNINNKAFLYRNNADKTLKNHYLSLRLVGNKSNTCGTGSKVTLYAGGLKQVAEQFNTRGFLSASSNVLHFGLGNSARIDSLIVRWPDLSMEVYRDIKADTLITCFAGKSTLSSAIVKDLDGNGLVEQETIRGLHFTHEEDNFTEFYREKLIPHSLASEGPALATGDINQDKRDDIFMGGAKGQASAIFVQQPDGSFSRLKVPALENDILSDVVDAAFFDADGDGDKDLYIVHGGNELPVGNPALHDVLLINTGKLNFEKVDLTEISHNGSCVVPADFDGDGDLDLFVGSRSIPGGYGLSPKQYLLENNGKGDFTDIIKARAGSLENAGMISGAAWLDADHDGDPDLVVAGEWMNICLFRNENGTLHDMTENSGLGRTSGLWYGIEAADLDGDGDLDIIGGNIGLNTGYKATPGAPVELFVNDLDHNGTPDPVISYMEKGIRYPMASLDELAGQIGGLKVKFSSYADFGGKTVEEIFGPALLRESLIRKAEMLQSCVFLNDGRGNFTTRPLPIQAQFAPIRDILAGDINQDGRIDLVVAGNDLNVRPSYGRFDASYGWIMLGTEEPGSFNSIWPAESRLYVKKQIQKLKNVKIGNFSYILFGINNDNIQIFRIK